MLKLIQSKDEQSGDEIIQISLSGKPLLTTPQLNKGTAFSHQERVAFNLLGKLPLRIETLEEQITRCYRQFSRFETKLEKNIYLNNLHNQNQILFYRLVSEHLSEMMPIIYTPIVGNSVKEFSLEFRQTRGLYLAYPERDRIDKILANRSNPNIELVVVTDGEGVLGIGDQGIGGMDIPVAKLMVYSLCGGINHLKTLPILLDVGTNNPELLNDPLYLGWRHERIKGEEYDKFIDLCVQSLKRHFPFMFLHWEDFGRDNARKHLNRYKNEICTFNDDMQGTGAVAVSAILAAIKKTNSSFDQQRIVVFGAGTAGTGISDQIVTAMTYHGMTETEARSHFWLIDRHGLLTDQYPDLTEWQRPYARNSDCTADWQLADKENISLLDVVTYVKPTILIGCSAVAGAFNEEIVTTMAKNTTQPIIFPLSNPTEKAEAIPEDLFQWSNGQALIATGSPFPQVAYNDKDFPIAQCNNALVFPGLGLGILAVKATQCSDKMLWAACQALGEFSLNNNSGGDALLPSLAAAREVATAIAIAVAEQAIAENLHQIDLTDDVTSLVKNEMWEAKYPILQPIME